MRNTSSPLARRDALLLAAAVGTAVAGCNPCQDTCEVVGDAYDECLGDWGQTWVMVGAADGRDQWVAQCQEEESHTEEGLDSEAVATRHDSCSEFNSALRGALDGDTPCDAAFQVLLDHAVTF